MEIMNSIYLNFFSVGAIIPFVFMLLIALFLISLPNKSKAAVHFAIFASGLALFNLGYVISGSIYHHFAAFHRWITVSAILFLEIFVATFFFRFPEERNLKTSRNLMIVQLILATLLTLYFFYKSWSASVVYNFDGHYWDFDADEPSKYVSYLILLYAAIFIGTAVWRSIIAKKQDKWAMIGLTLSICLASILPAITNTLSREGLIDRGLYQTMWDLFSILGMFMFSIIYINNTKDRTTFMVKIIGISTVTFLLAFQAISFISFDDKEEAYDNIHSEYLQRFVTTGFKSEDMLYSAEFNGITGTVNKNPEEVDLPVETYSNEYYNTLILEKIRILPQEDFGNRVNRILAETEKFPEFSGYRNYIKQLLSDQEAPGPETIINSIQSMQRTINYRANQIRKIPNKDFREKLEKFLTKPMGKFDPFRITLQKHLNSSNSEGQTLKNEVLRYLTRMLPAGERHYRRSTDGMTHYTAFMYADTKNNTITETGFSYLEYRKYIHPTAYRILLLIGFVLVIVLIGFRIFFLKALVTPLQELLGGVTQVNEGNLDTEIKIFVEDEIGYLSASFNSMVKSIKDANRRLAEYAETLEEKVKERTAELQATLEEVQALKQQQDGDYFLTSLLINPLGTNKSNAENVNVEFLVEQKKKFEFRKWQREIGGDLCMASDIVLKGKKHTFFMNADAMGKSMQGAGGILVLGSVMQSILERTRSTADGANVFPERWVKNAFIELHKIFEAFDGSMLISLVLGLVDDSNGLMYYINAEHPWTVLYRDNKASFIESELTFRKLGTQGLSGTLTVSTFQMLPGDVIFVGSDGRDDLLLETDTEGTRIINEDETLFLRKIEAIKGDLSKLKAELLKTGELTDDLSIIRISYRENMHLVGDAISEKVTQLIKEARFDAEKGDFELALKRLEEANKIDNDQPDVLRELVRLAIKTKRWDKAAVYAEDYVYLHPADSNMLYRAAYCKKRNKEYNSAIDLGERLKIREPNNFKNLLNLADSYFLVRNFTRARQILEIAEKIDPNNSTLIKLKAAIETYSA